MQLIEAMLYYSNLTNSVDDMDGTEFLILAVKRLSKQLRFIVDAMVESHNN